MTIAPPIKTGGDFGEDYERSHKLTWRGELLQIPYLIAGLQEKIKALENQRELILLEYPEFKDLGDIQCEFSDDKGY